MKVASLATRRDGQLVLVSRDLKQATLAAPVASSLQLALDDWNDIAPELERRYARLHAGEDSEAFAFDPAACASPLPRAYQWVDGSAYVNHVELVRRARGAEMPERVWHDPLMYQGGSDGFLAPTQDIPFVDPAWGLDFEGEVAVVTDDVPMGTGVEQAGEHAHLIMLVNDVSLRGLIPGELEKGFGFFQSKPASAFSPVAVTPDELGGAWSASRVNLPLVSTLNGRRFGRPDAGVDMTFGFAELIAHAAKTRSLSAGSIVGSGTVSNRQPVEGATTVDEGGVGYSCIAEQRMIETLRDGSPTTPFLTEGDRVRIEMFDRSGASLFGAIDQRVAKASR